MPEVSLREWEDRGPNEPDPWPRGLEGEDARRVAGQLRGRRILDVEEYRRGLRITTYSYVGRIGLGDLVLTIQPKVAPDILVPLLRYAHGIKKDRVFSAAPFSSGNDLAQDLVVLSLVAEVVELAERGLERAYVERRDDLAAPRGRLDISRMMSRAAGPQASLPCIHYLRLSDDILNRVIVGGLELAAGVASDPELRREARRVAARVGEGVSRQRLSAAILTQARCRITRKTRAYEPALSLTSLLFESSSVSLDEGHESLPIPGILFDMNRFFQALLARYLREHLLGMELREEVGLESILKYAPRWNPLRRRTPCPRPDFTVFAGKRIMATLDAKYRDLWEKKLPREMLYQLAMYSLARRQGPATILYPTTMSAACEARIEVNGGAGASGGGVVSLRPVLLQKLSASLKAAGLGDRRAAEQYAKELALGRDPNWRV